MEALQGLGNSLQGLLLSIGALGIIVSFAVIFIESIIPCMPLGVFVTGIFYSYGVYNGLLLCWIATTFGCMASYSLFNKYIRYYFEKKILKKLSTKTQDKIYNIMSYINDLSLSSLTLLVACPFTPAFVLNIAAGLADVDKSKYFKATIIGKPFMIYFFGSLGTSLLESVNNPFILFKVAIMLLIAYALSKICDRLVKA